ncbi:unnamed protein product [Calypogeia fissa]
MGNIFPKKAPPPVVLVPPLFDRPELATRSRMIESSYDILFSKLARARLFREYFEEADQLLLGRFMLQAPHDSRVDVTAIVRAPRSHTADNVSGEAILRFQRDWVDPNTFLDVTVSNSNNVLKVRACAFDPVTGLGVFASAPLISNRRVEVDDFGIIGLRYSTNKVSMGAVASPLTRSVKHAKAWVVGKLGPITAGVQYKPDFLGDPEFKSWDDPRNWSVAIEYGTSGKGPLNPRNWSVAIEVCGDYKLRASYYSNLVQRRVKNPFEEADVVGITNYIDLGFEFEQSLRESASIPTQQTNMQLAGSWQPNKNFLFKAKLGSLNSSLALCFKSWWQTSFTFSFAVGIDHCSGEPRYSFGVRTENRTENFGAVSYERADPNYVMLTPSKTHTAEGIMSDLGKPPMLQEDVVSGRPEGLPSELRPLDDVL